MKECEGQNGNCRQWKPTGNNERALDCESLGIVWGAVKRFLNTGDIGDHPSDILTFMESAAGNIDFRKLDPKNGLSRSVVDGHVRWGGAHWVHAHHEPSPHRRTLAL